MATPVDDSRDTVFSIGSEDVEGIPVYGAGDDTIGSVQRIMIDKISGKVAYAIVSFGGFLGLQYYPIPWSTLEYDMGLGGYRVNVTEDQPRGAPKYNRSIDWDRADPAGDQRVYNTLLWYFGHR